MNKPRSGQTSPAAFDLGGTLEKAAALREKLHGTPERSGCETRTKETLKDFLRRESDLELVDRGSWFYAAHREAGADESLALRADMDAVTGADGEPFHGCGHDGHSAVMAALAAAVGGRMLGKNLFFLFQHAEETGAGAAECCELFELEAVDAVFGFHNCPGFPAGAVLLLRDCFACASRGLILRFEGSQSHAAYPENGKNPVFPMAALFNEWRRLTDPSLYAGLTMATPIYMTAGSPSFGVAAGGGELGFTLRAWYEEDLRRLENGLLDTAAALAAEAGIKLSHAERDVFPATVNAPALYDRVAAAAGEAGLPCLTPAEPFRWSEDFGRYGARCPAFFLGIGGGEDAPGLHTLAYRWDDRVTEAALRLFSKLIGI